jgi:hypothetical protein
VACSKIRWDGQKSVVLKHKDGGEESAKCSALLSWREDGSLWVSWIQTVEPNCLLASVRGGIVYIQRCGCNLYPLGIPRTYGKMEEGIHEKYLIKIKNKL